MLWLRLVWWVVWRGVRSGAILGAVFGGVLGLLIGLIVGFFAGALIGFLLGVLNGVLLASISMYFYATYHNKRVYRQTIYLVAILANVVPFFAYAILGYGDSNTPITLTFLVNVWLFSFGVPALLAGLAASYFCKGFLKYVDAQMGQMEPRIAEAKVLS